MTEIATNGGLPYCWSRVFLELLSKRRNDPSQEESYQRKTEADRPRQRKDRHRGMVLLQVRNLKMELLPRAPYGYIRGSYSLSRILDIGVPTERWFPRSIALGPDQGFVD